MSWREAIDLTGELATDPSSHVAAAVAGWQFPASREWLALKVMADNYTSVKTSRRGAKLHQLPDPSDKPKRHVGTAAMSTTDLQAVLASHRSQAADTAPPQVLD
jgi:hypothetical protein